MSTPSSGATTMRITVRTPTALVAQDSAGSLRALGAFLLLLGGFIAAVGVSAGDRLAAVPLVLGGLVALGGLAAVALPSSITYAFDKEQRLLIVTRRGLAGSYRETHHLRDVAGVVLERSEALPNVRSSSPTWRWATGPADGRRQPWRSWYDSSYRDKAAVVV